MNTGYIQDTFDEKDVWLDEVLGESDVALPKSFRIENLHYEKQGSYPFCVSFACTTAAEWKYGKEGQVLSPAHLFLHANGSERGSTYRNNLNTLVNSGAIPYERYPMPDIEVRKKPKGWLTSMRNEAYRIDFEGAKKIKGYARVVNTPTQLKKALLEHGPVLVGVMARGSYYHGYAKREHEGSNHAVLLVGWDERDNWIIFDSLRWVAANDGYGYLDASYTFGNPYVITELPENWREVRDEVRKEVQSPYQYCLDHYGMPRNLTREQEVADQLVEEFSKFNNQSVWEAAGKFWPVYINAVAYGGYSISYRKWGKWMPGDIINDCYNWRRTGEHIFDFNKERKEYA